MEQGLPQSSNLKKYLSKHFFANHIISKFYEAVNELLSRIDPSCVMHLGCGEGFDIARISPRPGRKFQYVCGLDINFEALKICKSIHKQSSMGLVNGDMAQLPLKLDNFDTIVCLEVLEHLKQPRTFIDNVLNGFRGCCIFSVPNEPYYRLSRMVLLRADIRRLGNHPEHKNNWTKLQFVKLLENSFVIDEIKTPFPYTVVRCHRQ